MPDRTRQLYATVILDLRVDDARTGGNCMSG